MAKKMNRGLVALSSAAILSVYGIGYALSQPAVSVAAGLDGSSSSVPAPSASAAATSTASPAAASTASPAAASTASPAAASTASPAAVSTAATLKDGTYTGSGTSRHGGVNVSVTIKSGRIVAAPITSVTTRYSVNVIAGLPAEVASAQSANINLVSGATDSSTAYVQAVQQALAKANTGATSASTSTAAGSTVQVTGPQGVIYSSGSQNG